MELKTDKIKVLVFIDWFLPGDKAGGPVRSCANVIEHLGNEFDFSVITRDTDYTETKPMTGIKSNAWNILADGKRVYYISQNELTKTTITKLLSQEKYDVVYLNGIWSQPFTAWPLQILKNSKKKIVVAARGMLAPSALAIKPTKKKIFLGLSKLKKTFSHVIFHATTSKEKEEIKNAFGENSKILIAGNLPRKTNTVVEHSTKQNGKLRIINIARISPEKNTLYALQVLAKVKVSIVADFFGSVYDEKYWQECKVALEKLPKNIQVNFPGAIPSDEIQKKLSTYDLMFMPTRGENFGHVILESLQAGTPVLISDQTPWKNLAMENAGWELKLDAQEIFVKTIESICEMDEHEFSKWKIGARKLGANYSNDKKVLEDNRKLFLLQ